MKNRRVYLQIAIVVSIIIVFAINANADTVAFPKIGINVDTASSPKDVTSSVQILLLLTILSLAPSILIMMTSFTRIIIVLSFLRNALGTQQMPPNQVLIGLALFLSLFIMTPTITKLNSDAYQPFSKGQITQQQALDKASGIMKGFMLKQFGKNTKDLELFTRLAKIKIPEKGINPKDLPMTVVIPAFMINELSIAFKMGFLIFIPFLIIDMVVSSTLMSMGMMMLPPSLISLPFKILLFIMVGGWNLVAQTLVKSFIT
ncbi:MAG TPA: flagellar type III secretion system pore protein FliP [Clostridia bacterium]|nr:flagellar type III secretion system pore protein FliP [Clostridia bacterium]